MLARAQLEVMSAIKDLACPGREHGLAPPVILNAPRAVVSDDRGAQIGTRQFGRRGRGALDGVVNGAVDGFDREVGAVKVEHWKAPRCARKSRAPSEGARRWLRVPCRRAPRRDRVLYRQIRPG